MEKSRSSLDAGGIAGQNPAVPERLPGHTGGVASEPPSHSLDNEEDLGGRPAFLFEAGEYYGVSLDQSGANLPDCPSGERWQLARYFTLGVRNVGLPNVSPEPMIRGVYSTGYFMWRGNDPSRVHGTGQ